VAEDKSIIMDSGQAQPPMDDRELIPGSGLSDCQQACFEKIALIEASTLLELIDWDKLFQELIARDKEMGFVKDKPIEK
jgi:hypothetical protein